MSEYKMLLNGKSVSFTPGQTILEVARENGAAIPTLCYLKGATPTGACRMCLVEVEGARSLMASCSTPAANGMVVLTESDRVHRARKLTLELLFDSGTHDCSTCEANGDCRLQDIVCSYNITDLPFKEMKKRFPTESENPYIIRDFGRCILCGRCVQACNEIVVNRAISYGYRGIQSKIVTAGDRAYHEQGSECVFCGQCMEVCPCGALTPKMSQFLGHPWQVQKVRTTCPHCDVGCQQWLHVRDGRIVKVTAVEGAQPNQGRLCVKGRFGYDFIYSNERLKTPLIRENGEFRKASWDEALDLVASKFKDIIAKHGPDAIAGVSCARSLNEDSYQMQKLFRAVIGTNNIDHCAHTWHAPTVAGLAATFGSGAMTNSFEEFSKAKMCLVIGSNMTEAHPVAATFIKNAVLGGAKLIVVDPRRPALVDFATLHVPIKAGSDIAFLNGVMNVLIQEDLYDKEFVNARCTGFDELKAKVMEYPPERAAEITGIPVSMIQEVARTMAANKPGMVCYGTAEHTCGVSIANLQMLLGNMGVECGGVNHLRGQNNAQGACDMGALPNVFPGYQEVIDPAIREQFQKAWGVKKLPEKPGLTVPQMMDGILKGTVKALYVSGENLANTELGIHDVEHCLQSAEFLVCQDNFPTDTTRFAHVVFPSAAWSEDDGTFSNSERRVSRVRKVSEPPGQARPNWWIFKEIAKRMGHTWTSNSGQEIWDQEISRLVPALGGIKYHRLEGNGLQWPCPTEDHLGTGVLHKQGDFTCSLGQFMPAD